MRKKLLACILIIIMILTLTGTVQAANSKSIQSANILYNLGLFKGTGTNSDGTPIFELDRAPTRLEAVTMLVRLLGKDSEAKAGNWTTPFTDVAEWALPYVGYAYNNGLTLGTGATTFGGTKTISASQYITFILRALGFSSETDFIWDKAWDYSDELGLTNGEYEISSTFLRSNVAVISCDALSQDIKDTDIKLLAQLYADGAVTKENVTSAGLSDLLVRKAMTSSEVSAMASSAVFTLECYRSDDEYKSDSYYSGGSGFFISKDGVAVTNYHVIEWTKYARITTADGKKYAVEDLIYHDEDRDIAVIRVSKTSDSNETLTGFPFLKMVSSSTLSSGERIYAIGSPKGLQSTFTDGVVSNVNRIMYDEVKYPYIQVTAAISSGSSGGALINEYGEVVGVTAATIVDAQSINLAVPLDSILELDLKSVGATYEKLFVDLLNNHVSETKGYSIYEEVPDFGAYIGLPFYHIYYTDEDTFEFNYCYSVEELAIVDPLNQAVTKYETLLRNWGFSITDSFVFENNTFSVYTSSKSEAEVYLGKEEHDGKMYIIVCLVFDS